MLFPTVTFAVFLVVVMVITWALRPHPRAWRWSLLGASWIFYGWWDWRFVVLLGAVVGANHLVAKTMTSWPQRRTALFVTGVAINLVTLGFFKYYGFFVTSLLDLLRPLGLAPSIPLIEIVLPVGISFYMFEALSYLIEVRRGVVTPMPLLDLAVYLSFFPKLLSGPITRASELGPQLTSPSSGADLDGAAAFWLLGRGLFKKMVVATYLADAITDGLFSTPGLYSALETLAGIYAYTALIYVDFSAYTDMARGVAMLLGFRLPENFHHPYAATSLHDFWGRWHMSLTRWLRDFLFQPLVLLGSRRRFVRLANLMLIMLLVGLWHGPAWTFVVWGGIHGAGLVLERLQRERRRAHRLATVPRTKWRRLGRQALVFHFVAFAWVFFRADSISGAFEVLARLASAGPAPAVTPLLVLVLLSIFGLQHIPDAWSVRIVAGFRRIGPVLQVACLGLLLMVIDALGPEGVPPFIYTGF